MVFSRRRFLCGATAMGLSMPLFMRALEAQAASTGKIIVVVELNGGNDFFNTVVPMTSSQYGVYNDIRSNIALSASDLAATMFDTNVSTAASGATEYALHPRMTALRQLYGTGKLAILAGVGLPSNAYGNTDHEQARFAWSSGTINSFDVTETGWVGSAFDQLGQKGSLPSMIALNNSSPIIMRAKTGAPLVVNGNIQYFSPNTGSYGTDSTNRLNGLNTNDDYALASMPAEFARATASETEEYVSTVQSIFKSEPLGDYSTQYAFDPPSTTQSYSPVKTQLEQVARVLLAGSSSKAFWVSQGGYDTHGNQIANQAPILGEFSEGVSQFWNYMLNKNPTIAQNLIIMTISDFGRRPNSNSTAGTDHGTATVSFVIGGSVIGGLYGTYPSLSALDGNGNVTVPVDYRNQISDVCVALGADPTTIVGKVYPSLGMFSS
jgi:uncharacterized protein (DUF1501 family)